MTIREHIEHTYKLISAFAYYELVKDFSIVGYYILTDIYYDLNLIVIIDIDTLKERKYYFKTQI